MTDAPRFCALVVDDEEMVREITSLIMEENGGLVFTASGGEEAISAFHEHADKIDLVFLDFSMPKKTGYQVFLDLQTLKPSLVFIMGSGLSMTNEVAAHVKNGEIEFLNKPFSEQELMNAVKRALKKCSIVL